MAILSTDNPVFNDRISLNFNQAVWVDELNDLHDGVWLVEHLRKILRAPSLVFPGRLFLSREFWCG